MKKNILLILLLIGTFSIAQNLNLKEVKADVTNKESPFLYEKLVEEFKTNPSSFTEDTLKSRNLYYGKLYSGYYIKKINKGSEYVKFSKLISRQKYQKAQKIGEQLIKEDPVNLSVLLNLDICYIKTEEQAEKIKNIETQISVIMKSIARYGDGREKKSSFKVISTGDEFALLSYLGVNMDKYTIISKESKDGSILDTWVKDENYKADSRNKVFVKILSDKSRKAN